MSERILQIIPGDGWRVGYLDPDQDDDAPFACPRVVCFALVEDDDGGQSIIPVTESYVGETLYADDFLNDAWSLMFPPELSSEDRMRLAVKHRAMMRERGPKAV
jgi:hypothetical protein